MAYGFRFVPRERTATVPDNRPRCPFCHALLMGRTLSFTEIATGTSPHLCKETTYGTALSPLRTIPLESP